MCAHVPGGAVPMFIQFLPDQLVYKGLLKDKKGNEVQKEPSSCQQKNSIIYSKGVRFNLLIYQDIMVISVVTSTYILSMTCASCLLLPGTLLELSYFPHGMPQTTDKEVCNFILSL